jgi:excinuclease ABC subunit A
VTKLTPQQIVDQILAYPPESRIALLAPIVHSEVGEFRDVLEKLKREGFVRVRIDGEMVELGRPEPIRLSKGSAHVIEVVIDRLVIREGVRGRLADSVDIALKWGGHRLKVLRRVEGAEPERWEELKYSTQFSNPETGFTLAQLTPKHFSFNSHFGACPVCHGLGSELVCDAELMIPDDEKSLAAGAVAPWAKATKRMQKFYATLLGALAREYRVSVDAPFRELPEEFRQALFFGTGERVIATGVSEEGTQTKVARPFDGLVAHLQRLHDTTESELTRHRIRQYMSRRTCSACSGARLKPEILAVTVRSDLLGEVSIHAFSRLTIAEALDFMRGLELTQQEQFITTEVRREVTNRLSFLMEVGLGYLSLDRESGTLSGGEAQRIRLATQIGSGLAGCLYVLDEPSIGLHQRDNDRLIVTLRRLRDLGNSVIVVEHDEDTIRAADHVLDLGPGAGRSRRAPRGAGHGR